jgi:hypothetical protein
MSNVSKTQTRTGQSVIGKISLSIQAFKDMSTESDVRHFVNNQRLDEFKDNDDKVQQYITTVTLKDLLSSLAGLVDFLRLADASVLFSVTNLRVVYTAIEVVWRWSLQSILELVSGFSLPFTAQPSSILIKKPVLDFIGGSVQHSYVPSCVLATVNLLRELICNEHFSGIMIQRNMDRVLFGYFVLSCDIEGNNHDATLQVRSQAEQELSALQMGSYAGIVISKLRIFTGGPVWLRTASCNVLTGVLMRRATAPSDSQGTAVRAMGSSVVAAEAQAPAPAQGELDGLQVVLGGYLEGNSYYFYCNLFLTFVCFSCIISPHGVSFVLCACRYPGRPACLCPASPRRQTDHGCADIVAGKQGALL